MQSFFQQKSNRQQASRNASYLSTWFRSVWSTAQDAAAAAGTHRISSHSQQLSDTCVCTTTLCMLRAGTPMLTGKLPESPSRGAGYTSPLRASQQSIGMYKAAGMCVPTALSDQQHVPASKSMLAHFTFNLVTQQTFLQALQQSWSMWQSASRPSTVIWSRKSRCVRSAHAQHQHQSMTEGHMQGQHAPGCGSNNAANK